MNFTLKQVFNIIFRTQSASASRWFDIETCGATCSPSIPSTPRTTRTGSSLWPTSNQSWNHASLFDLQSQMNPRFDYPFVIRYQPLKSTTGTVKYADQLSI